MKIGIVTGASSGIGREFAERLPSHFHLDELWVIARRRDRLEEVRMTVTGVNVVVLPADLQKEKERRKIVKRIEKERPEIVVLVNNAGTAEHGLFASVSFESHSRTVDLNIKALMEMTHGVLPFMTEGSAVINIGSMLSYIPAPYNAVYAASKAFVLSFSEALQSELEDKKIRVIAVCPGPVATEFYSNMTNGKAQPPANAALPKDIVEQALKDLSKGKRVSIFGMKMKTIATLSPFRPKRLIANRFKRTLEKRTN